MYEEYSSFWTRISILCALPVIAIQDPPLLDFSAMWQQKETNLKIKDHICTPSSMVHSSTKSTQGNLHFTLHIELLPL